MFSMCSQNEWKLLSKILRKRDRLPWNGIPCKCTILALTQPRIKAMQLGMEYQLLIKEMIFWLWTQSWAMSVTAKPIVAATQNKNYTKLTTKKKAASRRDANLILTALRTCRWAFRLTSSTTSWPWLSNAKSSRVASSKENQLKSIRLQTSSEWQSRAQMTVTTLNSILK